MTAMNDSSSTVADDDDQSSSGLIAHIQAATEHQKAMLARELHDDLGGLLVGAVMDVAWAEQHLGAPIAELQQKLMRARLTLAAAIDLKRRLIEELRPTLLDNVGLFAALRWHVDGMCARAGIACDIQLPDDERKFQPNTPINLFRIVQETFAVVIGQGGVASADFKVTVDQDFLTIRILTAHGASAASAAANDNLHALSAIQQRTAMLGGEFTYNSPPRGGTGITAVFPIKGTLLPA
jgi:signal transduction histidine kinase